MHFQFRPAVPADAEECVRIRGLTRENAISEERLRSAGITAESWGRDIATGDLPGFVCLAEGQLVGYCFGAKQTGEVVVLALLPQFERLGVGQQLLGLVVSLLRGLGHRRLFLGCSPEPSCRAYGFYRHLGWRSTGTLDPHGDELLEYLEPQAVGSAAREA